MLRYPEEFKMQVLKTLKEENLTRTSELHHVGIATIRRWKRLADEAQQNEKDFSEQDKDKQEHPDLGTMLDELFSSGQERANEEECNAGKKVEQEPEVELPRMTQMAPAQHAAIERDQLCYSGGREQISHYADAFSILREQYQNLMLENRRLRRALLAMVEDQSIQL